MADCSGGVYDRKRAIREYFSYLKYKQERLSITERTRRRRHHRRLNVRMQHDPPQLRQARQARKEAAAPPMSPTSLHTVRTSSSSRLARTQYECQASKNFLLHQQPKSVSQQKVAIKRDFTSISLGLDIEEKAKMIERQTLPQ